MHKPKKRSPQSSKKQVDWLEYLDSLPQLVIPVGRPFQVDVPKFTGPANLEGDLGTSKWLGTRVWPLLKEGSKNTEVGNIGKGRPESCDCSSPNSTQCVKCHISEERSRLQSELGPAYESWKFDKMGEDVSKLWTTKQCKRFNSLVKSNPLSEGKSFLKPAELSFKSKSRDDIVSYYLNVYVPERIGRVTRSGCKILDSDDDEVEETTTTNDKNSLKRARSPSDDGVMKPHYLAGRR